MKKHRNTLRVFLACLLVAVMAASAVLPVMAASAKETYDLNEDGDVTISDVTTLLDLLSTEQTPDARYDLNGDGIVSIADVTALLDILATGLPDDPEPVSDTLTNENTYGGSGTTYKDWTVTGQSGAVYDGQSAGGVSGNESIQIRSKNSNSGIVTTESGGTVTEIVFTFNSETMTGRTVDVYGKNSPYESPADLYNGSKQGAKIGSVTYDGENATYTFTVEDDYEYVGVRSNDGAIYFDEITFTWNGNGSSGGHDDPPSEAVSDILTNANTYGRTGTAYEEWTLTGTSGAVYSGQSAGGNGTIQLRSKNSNSGIVTTTSGGKITKITVTFNSGTDSGRIVDVYASNTPYTSPENLYATGAGTQGTKIGSLAYDGKKATYTLGVSDEYAYVGLRSNSGALYLDEIVFEWNGEGGNDTPPTPVLETPEEIVNALYELGNNQTLPGGPYTLTGLVTAIPTAYSTQYENITVTIVVGDMTDMPIDCFRMKGEGADEIEIGDTITVTGELQNYYSSSSDTNTYEFRQGCELVELVKQEIGPAPETVVVTNAEYPTLDSLFADNPVLAPGLRSTGDVDVLVIPVAFTNSNYTNVREKLEIAFNGTNEQTGWRSLSSYYDEVSFGNLSLHATVTEIYQTGVAYDTSSGDSGDEYAYLTGALEYFDDTYDYTYFDADGDGYIDCVYLVYLAPFDATGSSDLWWAYTTIFAEDEGTEELRLDDKGVFWYMWFSIEFFDEPIYNDGDVQDDLGVTVNCETVIHETGHALGLDDYYDWVNGTQPGLGGLVMMDWNQGDHDPFSKAALGWIHPTILKAGEYETTLSSYTTTGDALFIAREGNDSLFDEFYIITYYTPDGVNALKAANAQELGYDFGVLSEAGILVYHVNSTLKDDYDSGEYLIYDVYTQNNGEETDRLIKVVEKEPCVEDGYAADSYWVLFGEGDSIQVRWNDGVNSHYTVNIGSITANSAEISVTWG